MINPVILASKNKRIMEAQVRKYESFKDRKPMLVFNIGYNIAYFFLSLVLVFAGVSKLYNPFPLLDGLRFSTPIPTFILIGLASFFAILETFMGLMLLLRIKVRECLKVSAVLFGIIFLFSIYCFINGIQCETGCFGGIIKSNFDLSNIITNSVLLLMVVSLLIKEIELPNEE